MVCKCEGVVYWYGMLLIQCLLVGNNCNLFFLLVPQTVLHRQSFVLTYWVMILHLPFLPSTYMMFEPPLYLIIQPGLSVYFQHFLFSVLYFSCSPPPTSICEDFAPTRCPLWWLEGAGLDRRYLDDVQYSQSMLRRHRHGIRRPGLPRPRMPGEAIKH